MIYFQHPIKEIGGDVLVSPMKTFVCVRDILDSGQGWVEMVARSEEGCLVDFIRRRAAHRMRNGVLMIWLDGVESKICIFLERMRLLSTRDMEGLRQRLPLTLRRPVYPS